MAKINITGQIHAATEEQVVTSANEIFDDNLKKRQSEINEKMTIQAVEESEWGTDGSGMEDLVEGKFYAVLEPKE